MAPPLSLLTLILILSTTSKAASTLDPKQLTALQSMGLPTAHDPCSSPATTLICDSSSPFRHVIALSLANCSSDVAVSGAALRPLSSLLSLSLSRCPAPLLTRHPLPLSLLSLSLLSLSSLNLTGVWLSRLRHLTHLRLLSLPISASGPSVFLSQMPHLLTATVSDCNLTGRIPRHWTALNLTHLDLSSNHLAGDLPETIGDLIFLTNLSLFNNSLSGSLPDSMKLLPELTHLDLGSNKLNGSLPAWLPEMKKLRFLNLGDNDFQGVMPFNASFINGLEVFRVSGNANMCYNHSLFSSKMMGFGIALCDKYGMPVPPPPAKSSKSDYGDDDEDDDGDESGSSRKSNGGEHGPNKLVLGVAIGLSCFVFLVIFLVCISKCWGS